MGRSEAIPLGMPIKNERLEVPPSVVVVESDIGMFAVDLELVEQAKAHVRKGHQERDPFSRVVEEHVGGRYLYATRYWSKGLGKLLKMFSEEIFRGEWAVEDEFELSKGARTSPVYGSIKIPGLGAQRFLHIGLRLLVHKETGERIVLRHSVDDDGDERLSVAHAKTPSTALDEFNEGCEVNDFGFQFLDALEHEFFTRGPLKGRFFDIDYQFIEKDSTVDDLIAWNEDVKTQLQRNVIDFYSAMPKLEALGLNTSRGIILAGPPGTGKTMIGKWLAAQTGMTSILVSAEMIRNRGNIRRIYERARLLSPTLIIVEDIDTTGGLDRRVSDHPLLGEFLQCMDGMVKNSGVITVATTNHASSIDPAIADRPGRFDRVIEVPLPNLRQRKSILRRKVAGIPQHPSVTKDVLGSIARRSDGLSGAWVIEIIQFAQVLALSRDDEMLTADDLEVSLDDVLSRRGLAYRIDSMPTENPWKDDEGGLGALWG